MIVLQDMVEALYSISSDRALSSQEVANRLAEKFNTSFPEEAESLIRKYKTSGTGLETTAEALIKCSGGKRTCTSHCNDCDESGHSCCIEINHENRQALEQKYQDQFGTYTQDMIDIAITMVESIGYASCDINLDKAEVRDTGWCNGGLYLPDHDKLYMVRLMDDLRESAVESMVDYMYQCPVEAAMHGLTGVSEMSVDELLSQAGVYDYEQIEVNKDETLVLIRFENPNS